MYHQYPYANHPQAGEPPQGPGPAQYQPPGPTQHPQYQAVYGYPGQGQTGFTAAQAAYPPGYQAYPGAQHQVQTPFFNFSNDRFLKGLLIGAAAAYLLTNESVQRTAIKGVVKLWSGLQGGMAEIKERFHDAEAEIRAEADLHD